MAAKTHSAPASPEITAAITAVGEAVRLVALTLHRAHASMLTDDLIRLLDKRLATIDSMLAKAD